MDILHFSNFNFQHTFCDLQNIAFFRKQYFLHETIDILHDSNFLMLKIYEILILNLCQKCRTKIFLYSHRNYTCLLFLLHKSLGTIHFNT